MKIDSAGEEISVRIHAVFVAIILVLGVLVWCSPATASNTAQILGRTPLRVGPGREFALPSVAAQFAKDGDVVEIDAGTYERDVAVWKQNDLTIRGIGGVAHLDARGASAQNKAIWLLRGNNTVIENIEFSGARVPDRNGAGIRLEGKALTVSRSRFHDNENGILCGSNPETVVVVEHSEFAQNGHGDGQSHNIYCGKIQSLTMQFNYIHHAKVGHNIKSRAARNLILFNRIGDETDGTSSYAVDLPNGGFSLLLGNIIQKGPLAQNRTMISYGAEGYREATNDLYVINNTLINERPGEGRFIFVRDAPTPAKVSVMNNLYFGPGTLLVGSGKVSHNLSAQPSDFRNPKSGDFRLSPKSKAIGAGIALGTIDGISLTPAHQYQHKAASARRANARRIDLGALDSD